MSAVHRLPPRPTPVLRAHARADVLQGAPGLRPTPLTALRSSEPRLALCSADFEAIEAPPASRQTLSQETDEEEPIDIVIAALRNATCESAIEASSLSLAWCTRAVRARAALAHLYDRESREFVIVYALGERAGHLLLTRHASTDPALAAAVNKGSPRVNDYGGARRPPSRYAFFGGAWSALVAPVLDGRRVLGAIELVDPLDGSCFDERAIAAVCYATRRLGELLLPFDGTIGAVIRPPED